MKKRIWSCMLCASLLLIGSVFIYKLNAETPFADDAEVVYSVSGNYNAHNKLNGVNDKKTTKFDYSHSMLLDEKNQNTLSADIAIASAELAMSAYEQEYVEACLEQMKYEYTPFNYNVTSTYKDNDRVAYYIATKKVIYHEKEYIIYLVPIRGTQGNCEWYSNFNIGTGANHEGFYKAANEVLIDLKNKIANQDSSAQPIVWTMGHSRGAAVANIVAGKMTGELGSENVFGYTYACPSVSKLADGDLNNIYNFNNPGDPITEVPLSDWGYKRFGKIVNLSIRDYENFKNRFYTVTGIKYGATLELKTFVGLLKNIAATSEETNSNRNQFLFDILGWGLGGKTNSNLLTDVLPNHLEFVPDLFIHKLTGGRIDSIAELMNAIESSDKLNYELREKIFKAQDETEGMTEEEFLVWKRQNKSLVDEIEKTLNLSLTQVGSLTAALTIIADDIKDNAKFHDSVMKVMALFWDTNGKPLDMFHHGHAPETYVLWINSMFYGDRGWYGWQAGPNDTPENQAQNIVVVDCGGSYIGDSCFANSTIQKITIKDGVKRIHDNACYNNNNLQEVEMADSVQTAGKKAFYACGALNKITMPVDLEYCSNALNPYESTFYSTNNIKEIVYSKGQTGEMPDKTDSREQAGERYYAYTPEGVSDGSLQKVSLEEGIKNIGDYAFNRCTSLKEVVFPESVKKIGKSAFYDCRSLVLEKLPEQIEEVGDYGFMSSSLAGPVNKVWKMGEASFSGTNISGIEFGSKMEEIPDSVCSGCKNLQEVKIADSVQTAGKKAFYACGALNKITMPVDLEYCSNALNPYESTFYSTSNIKEIVYSKGQTGEMPDKTDSREQAGERYYAYTPEGVSDGSLQKVSLEEGIKNIGDYAFNRCTSLKEVVFPESVKKIGKSAFYNCVSLVLEKLPEQIEEVGDYGFMSSSLAGPVNKVWKMGEASFSGTNISGIEFGSKMEEIPDSVCSGCKNLQEVKIADSVQTAGKKAFYACGALNKITMPVDLEYCSNALNPYESTFYSTSNIKEIVYSKGQTGEMPDKTDSREQAGERYYAYTPEGVSDGSLQKVSLEEGIKNIGDYAFNRCTSLKEVVFPESVKKIGKSAFYNCVSLVLEKLPEQIEEVGDYGFMSSSLAGPVNKVWKMGEASFSGTNISGIEFGSKMEEIPDSVCSVCKNLQEVKIADSVQTAGKKAFYACGALNKITMPVDLEYCSNTLNPYESTFYSTSNIKEIVYSKGQTGEMPDKTDSREQAGERYYAYTPEGVSNGSLQKVSLEEGIKNIGDYAFNQCTSLKKVLLPQSIKNIGDYAFNGTSSTLNLFGVKDSFAELYAKENNRIFIPLNYPIITPNEVTVQKGVTQQFTVKVYFDWDNYSEKAAWTVEGGKSSQTSITDEGLLTVGSDESAGMLKVKATAKGKTSSVSVIVEGGQKPVDLSDCTLTLEYRECIYDGTPKEPEVTLKYDNIALEKNVDYTVAYSNNIEPGTATVKVTAVENSDYVGVNEAEFAIKETPVADVSLEDCEIQLSSIEFIYDGTEKCPEVTVKHGETVLTEETHYTVEYSNNVEVGTAIVKITAVEGSGYVGAVEIEFVITEAPVQEVSLEDCEIRLSNTEFEYDGTEKCPEVTVLYGEAALTEGTHYTVEYSNNIEVGTASVKVTAVEESGYTGTKEAEFVIKEAEIFEVSLEDCDMKLAGTEFEYDGTEKCPEVTVKHGETVLTAGTHYTVEYSNNVEPGIATVKAIAIAGSGYTGSKSITFRIKKMEYADVKTSDWYYDYVVYVSLNGIMTGITKDTFGPDESLTRAQFATILYRVNGEPVIDYNAKFPDVAEGQWYTKGVLWANSIGVVGGYGNGLFGPDDNITREQMALMMYRYAKYKEYDISKIADISSFKDAFQVSSYAEEAFKWAVGSEIIGGKAGNQLAPQGKATRAECATIIMRFMKQYEK